jgi:leader peptidase (prepilin peptidase)/N-methyltransferase
LLEIALAFLAGLLIGSFLNVCIFRLPRDLSVVRPRSFCPGCVGAAEERGVPYEEAAVAGALRVHDLMPVVSYVLLGGRCRRCRQRIPLRYPLVELAAGAAFAICAAYFGWSLAAVKYAVYSSILITLIVTDLEERILPDEFTLGGIGAGLVLAAFVPMPLEIGHLLLPAALGARGLSVGESAVGAGVTSGLIWFLGWAYHKIRRREGLGFGDVKMIGMIGAFIGLSSTLLTMLVASLAGSLIGGGYILIAKKKASEYELPFGSFLGASALAVAAYAEWAFQWYSQRP